MRIPDARGSIYHRGEAVFASRLPFNDMAKSIAAILSLLACLGAAGLRAQTQATGAIRGTVTLEATRDALHHASVLLTEMRRTVETADDGSYVFDGLPPGTYNLIAHMHDLTAEKKTVKVVAGAVATADFSLRLAPVRQQVTVTASGQEESSFQAIQTVTSLESLDLAARSAPSLGEVLEGETGVAKRSFGPGTSRPVIRGFDGDRVLIMQDGMPTGTL
ncbi:MAG: beta-sandwich domain-containing protein, partial [Bryobacteraceae bacterium]